MPSTARATRSRQPTTPISDQDVKENITPIPQPNVSQPSPKVRGESLKKRHKMSSKQLICLESLFQKDTHPSRQKKRELADELGMDFKTITIWFQNKRQTAKRTQGIMPSTSPQSQEIVPQTLDHQVPLQSPSLLRRVSSPSKNDTLQPLFLIPVCSDSNLQMTPCPRKQANVVNDSLLLNSMQVKPLLSPIGSFFSPKSPEASPRKDQAQPPVTDKTNARELWRHLPSSPDATAFASDRGAAIDTACDGSDTPCGKRHLTLEWACDRQAKRRRGARHHGSNSGGLNKLWVGPPSQRTSSALSLLSLAAGKVNVTSPAGPAPSQDVIRGASLLLSFKHSLRGCNAWKK